MSQPAIRETLTIIGASARAAAASARRAGWPVFACDLFGDYDLAAEGECVVARDYPRGLFEAARQAPPGPWLYTGGLENFPALLKELARERELLGVADMSCVRELPQLNQLLRAAELPLIEYRDASAPPTSGRWLCKPLHSSGGMRIQAYDAPPYTPRSLASVPHYWTPRLNGVVHGATYVIGAREWQLLGVCEQLSGAPWTGATSFAYAGSLGPIELSPACTEAYERLGEVLFATGKLRGLIGIDAIVTDDEQLHVIEINPRYPASVELLEEAHNLLAIDFHVRACLGAALPSAATSTTDCTACGKAVLYAPEELTIEDDFLQHCLTTNAASGLWPAYADLPHPGSRIARGEPILTLFARGGCVEKVHSQLKRQATATFRLLKCNPPA